MDFVLLVVPYIDHLGIVGGNFTSIYLDLDESAQCAFSSRAFFFFLVKEFLKSG